MLKIEDLEVNYGSIRALKGVGLSIERGEIVALIGSNGAGKTTLLNAISGLVSASRGTIEYDGQDIVGKKAEEIVRLGISQCPEGRMVFPRITVYENLLSGAFIRREKREVAQDINEMFRSFPVLRERRSQLAATLSGGEQQMLAICRSLMSRPKILLLDEPSMGLAPTIIKQVFEHIKKIRSLGTTVFLVEQNAYMALNIGDRAYVLETGEVVKTGDARAMLTDDFVRKSYLGE